MRRIIALIWLLMLAFRLVSQEDTITDNQLNRITPNEDYSIIDKQGYLNINFREEKTLLKLGISPLNFLQSGGEYDYSNFNGMIGFERKILPSLSYFTNTNFSYLGNLSDNNSWQFTNDVGLRYYYSIQKRIKNNIGANNFHCNYISLMAEQWVEYNLHNQDNVYPQNGWDFNPEITLSWGVHRRIEKWGFIDLGPYISYVYKPEAVNYRNSFSIGFNFKFGLAVGW